MRLFCLLMEGVFIHPTLIWKQVILLSNISKKKIFCERCRSGHFNIPLLKTLLVISWNMFTSCGYLNKEISYRGWNCKNTENLFFFFFFEIWGIIQLNFRLSCGYTMRNLQIQDIGFQNRISKRDHQRALLSYIQFKIFISKGDLVSIQGLFFSETFYTIW